MAIFREKSYQKSAIVHWTFDNINESKFFNASYGAVHFQENEKVSHIFLLLKTMNQPLVGFSIKIHLKSVENPRNNSHFGKIVEKKRSIILVIPDMNNPFGIFSFSSRQLYVEEGIPVNNLFIIRKRGKYKKATVELKIKKHFSNSAEYEIDFSFEKHVIFLEGEAMKPVNINIIDDNKPEIAESIVKYF